MIISRKITYRLYGLVPYNLSPIQQGIQFGHALQEFNNFIVHQNPSDDLLYAFNQWANTDKTFIILNGGTTNNKIVDNKYIGSLNNHKETLDIKGIPNFTFYEPDLGDQLTAVVFLVDSRVFDKEMWPDYHGGFYLDGKTPIESEYYDWKMNFSEFEKESEKIIFLRDWLKNFRLA